MPRSLECAPADRAVKAREVQMRNAAIRAIDDPKKVDRAARIVSAALDHDVLTPEVRRLVDQAVEQGYPDKIADPDVIARVAAVAGGDAT